MSSKYRHLYQFYYVNIFSTKQNGNLVLLDDPGRVRSQITNVEGQIQRFDFDCILVVSRKVIIRIPPVLGTNPLYCTAEFVQNIFECLERNLPFIAHRYGKTLKMRDPHFAYEIIRNIAKRGFLPKSAVDLP